MDASLHESYQRVLHAASVDELRQAAQNVIEALGFRHYMYLLSLQDSNQPAGYSIFSLGTYPSAWIERYTAQKYHLVDPAAIHVRQHYYPLVWSNSTFQEPRARRMYQEAKKYGISAGVSCPISGQWQSFAGLGYACEGDADELFPHSLASMPFGYLLSSYVHEAVTRLLTFQTHPLAQELTPRETECLNLAAQGFADAEIAWNLGVNVRTIRFHLKNVRNKLQASTRVQMISRAIDLKLIGL